MSKKITRQQVLSSFSDPSDAVTWQEFQLYCHCKCLLFFIADFILIATTESYSLDALCMIYP